MTSIYEALTIKSVLECQKRKRGYLKIWYLYVLSTIQLLQVFGIWVQYIMCQYFNLIFPTIKLNFTTRSKKLTIPLCKTWNFPRSLYSTSHKATILGRNATTIWHLWHPIACVVCLIMILLFSLLLLLPGGQCITQSSNLLVRRIIFQNCTKGMVWQSGIFKYINSVSVGQSKFVLFLCIFFSILSTFLRNYSALFFASAKLLQIQILRWTFQSGRLGHIWIIFQYLFNLILEKTRDIIIYK